MKRSKTDLYLMLFALGFITGAARFLRDWAADSGEA